MIKVHLIYNPFNKKCRLFFDNMEICDLENKVYSFLKSEEFHELLYPFNKRYVIWQGLLPELVNEVNDSELHIIFEGLESDFSELEKAFEQCKDIVLNIGYENQWHLSHVRNFDEEHFAKQMDEVAEQLGNICETRAELREIARFVTTVKERDVGKNCRQMQQLLVKHIEKWEDSREKYKEGKISYLKMLEETVKEIKDEYV